MSDTLEHEYARLIKLVEERRLAKNHSQADLAGALGLSPVAVCNFLNGRSRLSYHSALRLMAYFGIKVTDINPAALDIRSPREKDAHNLRKRIGRLEATLEKLEGSRRA